MSGISTEDLMNVGKVLAGALIVLVPLGVKYIRRKAAESHFTHRKLDSASLINNRVIEMRAKLNVDRVAIFEFSNGEKTVTGFPFLYSTMTFERVADSVASMKEQFNKVPASWFAALNGFLVNAAARYAIFYANGAAIVDGVKMETPDAANIIKGYHISTNALFKISADIGDGLLAISDHNREIEFTEEELSQIQGDLSYIHHIMQQRPK